MEFYGVNWKRLESVGNSVSTGRPAGTTLFPEGFAASLLAFHSHDKDYAPRRRFGTMLANAAAGYFCGTQAAPVFRRRDAAR